MNSTLSVTKDVSIFKLEDPRRESRKALPSGSGKNRQLSDADAEDDDDDD